MSVDSRLRRIEQAAVALAEQPKEYRIEVQYRPSGSLEEHRRHIAACRRAGVDPILPLFRRGDGPWRLPGGAVVDPRHPSIDAADCELQKRAFAEQQRRGSD